MKRLHSFSTKRKLSYSSRADDFHVDHFNSPSKRRHVSNKAHSRMSSESRKASSGWDSCMDGFAGFKSKEDANNGKTSTTKAAKVMVTPKQHVVTPSPDTQQEICSWESSDEEVSSPHVIAVKTSVTKARSLKKTPSVANTRFVSQESLPSIDDSASPRNPSKLHNGASASAGLSNKKVIKDVCISDYESEDELEALPDDAANQTLHVSEDSMSPVISSARSQSEQPSLTDTAHTKTKASDWLKEIQWQRTSPGKCGEVELKLEDSAKKKKNKYTKDGLAAKMERIVQQEKSSYTFWSHKCTQNAENKKDLKKPTVLQITSYQKRTSLVFAVSVVSTPGADVKNLTADERVTLVVSEAVWGERKLCGGAVVCLYPPWQVLHHPLHGKVVLCTNHCQLSAQSPLGSIADTTGDTGHRGNRRVVAEWACRCAQGTVFVSSQCPAHLGPVKVTRPTPDIDANNQQTEHSHPSSPLSSQGVCLSMCPGGPVSQAAPAGSSVSRSILEAVERAGGRLGGGINFLAVVQRIYAKSDTDLSLLVQDYCGFLAEVTVPPDPRHRPPWQAVIDAGEGRECELTGLRVARRITQDTSPKFFSIVESVWRPESVVDRAETSQQSSQGSDLCPLRAPSFSYVLVAPPGESACHCRHEDARVYRQRTDSSVSAVVNGHSDVSAVVNRRSDASAVSGRRSDVAQRYDITGNVIYSKLSGAVTHLYLVDPSPAPGCLHLTLTDQHTVHRLDGPVTVRVRDVLHYHGSYSVDEYSHVERLPTRSSEGDTVHKLAELTPTARRGRMYRASGAVSGVDEETAYSWLACPLCGCDDLQGGTAKQPFLHCPVCQKSVSDPVNRVNLEVYIWADTTKVKVKLRQPTIQALLPPQVDDEGYDIQCVLGKMVGPLPVLVTSSKQNGDNTEISTGEIQLYHCGS